MEVATVSDFDRLMGDSLKAIRDDHVRQIEAEIPAARQHIASKIRWRRFTFVIGGVVVAAGAVAVALFIAQSVPKIDRAEPIPPSGSPVVVARIDVPGVAFMDAGLDSLWVTHERGIVQIDPSTRAIGIESPVHPVDGIDLNGEAMYAIDTVGRNVSRIPFGSDEGAISTPTEDLPTQVVASDERIWYSVQTRDRSTRIVGVDPDDLSVELEAPAFPRGIVADMTYAEGELWATTSFQPGSETADDFFRVARIDPNAGTVEYSALSTDEGSAADISIGDGAVWVLRHGTQGGGNAITRVDMETGEVDERAVVLPDTLEAIAFGEGYLWATTAPTGMDMPDDTRASLHRIDPDTLKATGDPLEVSGPGSKLAVGYGFIWVGDPINKQIVQIDPASLSKAGS